MAEPFLGQLMLFGGNFAPRGWALCNGQILAINQNTALFSLLGTTYGGNGQTTFALPDLRGRAPLHAGQGPGLSPYALGQVGGTENVTLLATEMPAHTHAQPATAADETTNRPNAAVPAAGRRVREQPGRLEPGGDDLRGRQPAARRTSSPTSLSTTASP